MNPIAIFAVLFLALWAPSSQAQKTLLLGHGSAEESPRHLTAVRFAQQVALLSKGALKITIFPSAKAGDDAEMVAALREGRLDISANSTGALSAVVPEYSAFGLPYLFHSLIGAWNVLEGPVGADLAQLSARQGLLVLSYWDNGFRQMTNSKRPLFGPAELKGLKIRTPPDPMTIDFLKALGAQPVSMKFSKLHEALKTGEVDGQENPLSNIYTGKLYEVQRYLTFTSHMYTMTPFVISKIAWDRLDDKERGVLRAATQEATHYHRELMLKEDERQVFKLKATGIVMNYTDSAAFLPAAESVKEKWSHGEIGDFVKKVIAAAKQQ